jgi:AhpD family alkylhydroperoxidase
MQPRLDWLKVAPGARAAIWGVEKYARDAGLETSLLELVRLRASQLNGCGFCIDMHAKDARAEGETEQRLYCLPVWRETPFYSDRERAALEWTEAVTLLADSGAPDSAYDAVKAQFSESEIVSLTMAVIAINSWNRIAVAFRAVPGTYQRP